MVRAPRIWGFGFKKVIHVPHHHIKNEMIPSVFMSHRQQRYRKTGPDHSLGLADSSGILAPSSQTHNGPCLCLNYTFQWFPTALSITAKLPNITPHAFHCWTLVYVYSHLESLASAVLSRSSLSLHPMSEMTCPE